MGGSVSMCVCMCMSVCVCVCVCERKTESVCLEGEHNKKEKISYSPILSHNKACERTFLYMDVCICCTFVLTSDFFYFSYRTLYSCVIHTISSTP